MYYVLYLVLGLLLGGIGTSWYLGKQIRDLKDRMLDKQTIAKLLKDELQKNPKAHKPTRRSTYNKKRKYSGNGKKSTKGMKISRS